MRNRELGVPSERITENARALRSHPTAAEAALWLHLRGKQIGGLKFRRQEPVGPYIVDFLCSSVRLIVEVDGLSHEDTRAEDQARQDFLEQQGFCVLRFSNDEVLKSPDAVVGAIASYCWANAPTQPPPKGEEHV